MAISEPKFHDIRYEFPREILDIQNFLCFDAPPTPLWGKPECDTDAITDQNQRYFFKRACDMKQQLYHTDRNVYTNVFCYLCRYTYPIPQSTCGSSGSPSRTMKDSFYMLLTGSRWSAPVQQGVTTEDSTLCSCAEFPDTSKNVCREILCPPGEMRNMCECVPFITNITGMNFRLHLEIRPQLPESAAKDRFGDDLQNNNFPAKVTKAVKRLIAYQFGPLTSDKQYLFRKSTATEGRILTFHYFEILTLQGVSDDRKELENMFTTLHIGLTKQIVGTQMKISLDGIFDVDPFYNNYDITGSKVGTKFPLELLYPGIPEYEAGGNVMPFSQPLTKLVYCKRVALDEDEDERLHNVTAALGWSRAYLEYVYWQEDGSMCIEDFEAAFMPNTNAGAYSYNYPTQGYHILMISTLVFHRIILFLK